MNIENQEFRLVTTFTNNVTNKFYADVSDYNSPDIYFVLRQAMPYIIDRIQQLMGRGKKFRISMEGRFVKPTGEEMLARLWGTRGQMPRVILPHTDLEEEIMEQAELIEAGVSEIEMCGSGWVLEIVSRSFIELYRYEPLKGGTYVKTPKYLGDKKALINVDNSGNKSLDEIRHIAGRIGIEFNTKTSKKQLVELIKGREPNVMKDNKVMLQVGSVIVPTPSRR